MMQGLALYNSLQKHEKEFKLYWLCIDDETYTQLKRLDFKNIVLFRLSHFESQDESLRNAKLNPACLYGTQYSQYCWALTPYFINYILNFYTLEDKMLMYIDSDIIFYESPRHILNDIGDCSIGIHSHRGESKYDVVTNPVGEFNVGVVVFRNDEIGRQAAAWWKNCLLNTDNKYYKVYGTCGDQKYLDLFIPLFKSVCVFDRKTCGYLAPWCFDNVTHLEDEKSIIYKGIKQKVIFYHFSHFTYDLSLGIWNDSYNGEWHPGKNIFVKKYYQDYLQSLYLINNIINA